MLLVPLNISGRLVRCLAESSPSGRNGKEREFQHLPLQDQFLFNKNQRWTTSLHSHLPIPISASTFANRRRYSSSTMSASTFENRFHVLLRKQTILSGVQMDS